MIRTTRFGVTQLVILLHGFPETSFELRHPLRAPRAAGYRAVAPDQRGYSPGARPEAVNEYVVPLLVQDVLGLATELGAESFHVVGHDWGAVPHPGAFATVLADTTSCQYTACAYFDFSPSQSESHAGGALQAERCGQTITAFHVGVRAGKIADDRDRARALALDGYDRSSVGRFCAPLGVAKR